MKDPIKTLAKELYIANILHGYARITSNNASVLESSYQSFREKILANFGEDEDFYSGRIKEAERLLDET